jgi:heat-inducible transcriptional repressor
MLDERRSLVLQALVEEYIRSGEPVSSQAILSRSGLDVSSATIRNDLARLESDEYVTQPHTSAGRVPTHQGYRYYVDHCAPGRLRTTTRARIEAFFTDVHQELSRMLKETSGLLSDITHFPAVVVSPGIDTDVIHGVSLVRLGGSAVLVVIVSESGRVSQQVVDLRFVPTSAQLEEAERLIENACVGTSTAEAAERLNAASLPDIVRNIVEPVESHVLDAQTTVPEVFVGGTSQLAELWNDLAIVHRMLELLERETSVLELMEASEGTAVRIGAELGDDLDMAVVSSSYHAAEGGEGRVAVIGPMRMDYRRTIRVVEEIGEGLEESLGADR